MTAARPTPDLQVVGSPESFYYPRASANLLPNIPHELTQYKSWVVWKEAPNGASKKYRKLPLNPMTLDGKDWNNPRNWSHRATATQVFEENPYLRGIGFVFSVRDEELGTKGEPYAFFDLDSVIVRGKLLAWAAEFVEMVSSYTEISNSGTGVKIIVKANVGARKKTFEFTDSNGDAHELEVYDSNRFFAATGNRLKGTPDNIVDCQELLDALHPPGRDEDEDHELPSVDRTKDRYASDVDKISDESLIYKIGASSTGKKFQRLMNGKKTGYAGNFAASGALCAILAYWTRADAERVDRIFKRSKLYVDWWWKEEKYAGKKSRSEYVIEKACRRAQAKEMYTPRSTGLITDDNGRVLAIMANAINALKSAPEWKDVLAFNELTLMTAKLKPAPWSKQTGAWTDFDDTKLLEWFQHRGIIISSSRQAGEAANTVAFENSFHPIRDYLNSLKWDGKRRLNTWLPRYLGTPLTKTKKKNKYVYAIGRCWMISAVARIFKPGCKADCLLVLEGDQGAIKSTALNILAGGDEFFLDDFTEFEDKDEKLKLHGAWIVELAELAGTRRDVNKVKAFLSSKDDVFRAPYDKRPQHHPRMNVFAGSTNDDNWLTDETGGRRFWPAKCGKINAAELEKNRDQLWAEAIVRFRNGEHWWLDDETEKLAKKVQRKRYQPGQWDETIEAFLDNPTQRKDGIMPITPWNSSKDQVTVDDVLLHAVQKPLELRQPSDVSAVTKCLRHNHWKPRSVRRGKIVLRVWEPPPEEDEDDGDDDVTP